METKNLRLTTPGLVSLLKDARLMQRWEILRRASRPLSAPQLAEATSEPTAVVLGSLDRLLDAGFAVPVRATQRNRVVRYRAAFRRLVIEWDDECAADRACMREIENGVRGYSREVIDRCRSTRRGPHPGRFGTLGATSVLLLDEDADAVRNALHAAYAALVDAEQRARDASTPGRRRPIHVTFEIRELDAPEPHMAEIYFAERKQVPRLRRIVVETATEALSPRELEIARALNAGKLRPQVAWELGISENTVSSISKRIYRKLGVHNRAELSGRLRVA